MTSPPFPVIISAAAIALIVFLILALTGTVAFNLGFKEGWTVGSACTVAARPADAGNVSHGRGACAPP
jgi:hypothetical protein